MNHRLQTRLQYRMRFVARQKALRDMDDPEKWTAIPRGSKRFIDRGSGQQSNCWILWDEFGVGISAEEAAIEMEED